MRRLRHIALYLPLLLVVIGCNKDVSNLTGDEYLLKVPTGFPEPILPDDNPLTKSKVALGKKLFFDPALSLDSSTSCASCHLQKNAFADPNQLSVGVNNEVGERNASALFNLAYGKSFFRDGGSPTLELQILSPLDDEKEMNLPINKLYLRLQQSDKYVALFKEVFDTLPTPFGITRAIAAYERTLISGNSAYDRYQNGDRSAMTSSEKRGMNLFFSTPLNCSKCHSGFNFTNEEYHNNGLYSTYIDTGRARITLRNSDYGKFKIPSLRNIAITGPYMHDGSLSSLEEVIDHYAAGGKNNFNQSDLIGGFKLTDKEKNDLISFLNSLTDTEFISSSEHGL